MPFLPERMVDRLIVTPPAGGSGVPLANGWPCDSGAVMIERSNLSHLCFEAPRPLVQSPGFVTTLFPTAASMFQDIPGYTPPLGFSGVGNTRIPWDRRSSARFGPYFLVLDKFDYSDTWRRCPRSINFAMRAQINATATSYYAIFAVTIGDTGGNTPFDGAFASAEVNFGGTGARTATTSLALGEQAKNAMMSGRADGLGGGNGNNVLMAYLWFGWAIVGGSAASSIVSMSAWETRL